MHEYPMTMQLVEIASREAGPRGRVTAIELVVGDDSGFVGASIEMYFEIIAAGTPCQGARLSIERVRPKLKCAACGAYFERKPFRFDCPDCGGEGRPSPIGKECYVKSVTVEEEDEACTP